MPFFCVRPLRLRLNGCASVEYIWFCLLALPSRGLLTEPHAIPNRNKSWHETDKPTPILNFPFFLKCPL